jgi:hypothetical protein
VGQVFQSAPDREGVFREVRVTGFSGSGRRVHVVNTTGPERPRWVAVGKFHNTDRRGGYGLVQEEEGQ